MHTHTHTTVLEKKIASLTKNPPHLPDFSRFHEAFSDGTGTKEGNMREAYYKYGPCLSFRICVRAGGSARPVNLRVGLCGGLHTSTLQVYAWTAPLDLSSCARRFVRRDACLRPWQPTVCVQ